MSGPLPISYTEIKAWSELTGAQPSPWEVMAVKRLDQIYIAEAMKKHD